MALFTRIVTVFLPVYDFQLVLRFSRITTVVEGKSKGFAAYFEEDNLLSLQVTSSHPQQRLVLYRRFTLSQGIQHQKRNFLIQ